MASIIKEINKQVEIFIKEIEMIIEKSRKEIEKNGTPKTRQTQNKNISNNK